MNLEKEKQSFLYELKGHGYDFKSTDWYDDWERFEDEQLNMAWEMWLAGEQSKQSEIDALQKRIDEAWTWCEKGCVLKAMEILKGEETK